MPDDTLQVVVLEGRRRGFHDYNDETPAALFSQSCRFIVFVHGTQLWVAEVAERGRVGALAEGWDPRPVPQ